MMRMLHDALIIVRNKSFIYSYNACQENIKSIKINNEIK